MKTLQKYFDPEVLANITPLSLRAKTVIEGLLAGAHRTNSYGHSIEFAQHREYSFGDDLRSVDWKVFARSDKYYVKQYEDETTLECYLVLDQSESMRYRGTAAHLTKLEYAQLIMCSLAFLVLQQQDRVGLATFSDGIDDWLPVAGSMHALDTIIATLESYRHGKRTSIQNSMASVLERIPRKSLVILISDLLDDAEATEQALRAAKFAGHDCLVIGVLDEDEVSLPLDDLCQLEDLESGAQVLVDPTLIAAAYHKEMQADRDRVNAICGSADIGFFDLRTRDNLGESLSTILQSRRWSP